MNCFRINADKYASFIAIKGNCSAPGKIRLSERRRSLLILPSVRILSKGEAGEGKNINMKLENFILSSYN